MGTLGNFPEPVWYNPSGIANILSLNSMKKYYRVIYDNSIEDCFIVGDEGNSIPFQPSIGGLYYMAVDNITNGWAMIQTVAENQSRYNKPPSKKCSWPVAFKTSSCTQEHDNSKILYERISYQTVR
jgi:hypothetical protein